MSSVTKFSLKSQVLIAQQDSTIAAMRSTMLAAGLDPNSVVPVGSGSAPGSVSGGMDINIDVTVNSKKRLPSGSPNDEEVQFGSDDSNNDAVEDMDQEKGKADWRLYQLKKNKRSLDKKMSKKAKKTCQSQGRQGGKNRCHY